MVDDVDPAAVVGEAVAVVVEVVAVAVERVAEHVRGEVGMGVVDPGVDEVDNLRPCRLSRPVKTAAA